MSYMPYPNYGRCPSCGRCPACGRGGNYYHPYPEPYLAPKSESDAERIQKLKKLNDYLETLSVINGNNPQPPSE